MANTHIIAIAERLTARLNVLARMLRRGERHAAEHGGDLLHSRIAPDMHPFPTQILFACNQTAKLAEHISGTAMPLPEAGSLDRFEQLHALIATVRAAIVDATEAGDDSALAAPMRITLPGGAWIDLNGQSFVDQWLIPNMEFHMAMAYALMRANGVALGKADWLAHMGPHIRTA